MGLFSLYLAEGAGERLIFLSPEPAFDFAYLRRSRGYRSFACLGAPLPAGIAACILLDLRKGLQEGGRLPFRWEQLRKRLLRALGPYAYRSAKNFAESLPSSLKLFSESSGRGEGSSLSLPAGDELDEVERLLAGRLLRRSEIARLLGRGAGARSSHLARILQALSLAGRVFLLPALLPLKGSLVRCQRCGWEGIPRPGLCRKCGSTECAVCPECLIMGGVSLCEFLYTGGRPQASIPGPGLPARAAARLAPVARLLFPGAAAHLQGEEGRERIFCPPLLFRLPGSAPENRAPGAGEPCRSAEPPGRGGRGQGLRFRMELELTPPQEAAAHALLELGRQENSGRACLVWAACGAGKTEVSFPLIGEALAGGKKVLFAAPRRDVVLEVAPRLARAFGSGEVVALYGGSGNWGRDASLVVATTHQTLRFDRSFDLVILDEGDAFPYPGSRMLRFGVARARRPGGKLVYLTATPDRSLLAGARRGLVDVIKIPARPHGFPLPEPRFLRLRPLRTVRGGCVLHGDLLALIKEAVAGRRVQVFLFVPTVEMTEAVGRALRAAAGKPPLEDFSPAWIEWSHAGDPARLLKRERFFAGEFPVLVTTTIMERGVTVPRVHVFVLNADHVVFDAPTLVQIAGRCGRSPDYPGGEVWFAAPRVTREMEEALAQIRAFNTEALRAGYLRPDYPAVLQEILRREAESRGLWGNR
ncbi:MAG: DEAD/DEAH box helicase family protein [Firmicutes bacterium]|nr:DEAD/DEAH box helicase family protein [Bacillota bacterium]